MNLHFENTETLIALSLVPILVYIFWQLLQWKKRSIRQLGDPSLVTRLFSNFSSIAFRIKFILACTALSLLIIGAANPRQANVSESIERNGIDIMIALDLSASMTAEDERPSRLEKARLFLEQFIQTHPNDRVGLIVFAGKAFLQMPLSHDQSAFLTYLQQADPALMPVKGTNIAAALRACFQSFQQQDLKHQSIILITDGEEHDENAARLSKELETRGVMVHTVGIGTPEGASVKEPGGASKFDNEGALVISRLNEKLLQQIAGNTNGVYVHLQNNASAIEAINAKLDTIEKTPMTDQNYTNYHTYFQYFLLATLVLLCMEFFIPEKKVKWLF